MSDFTAAILSTLIFLTSTTWALSVYDRKQKNSMDPTTISESLNWLHSLMQELEDANVELPMGDFNDVYGIIEDAREAIEQKETS